jgi:hypothetical protein
MSVFKIKEVIRFTGNDLKAMGEDLAFTHISQAKDGIDATGKPFAVYTPAYAKRKAQRKAGKNQVSTNINPPDLTLTGTMWREFKYLSSSVSDELHINYGINDPEQAQKMISLQKGRFGKPGRKSRVTMRKDKARVVARHQKVGPEVEERIALLFARNITKNLNRLTNRPTIIRM